MSQHDPAARFATELEALYRAAGSPKHGVLIFQASRQTPSVKLNAQSLSDWFGGTSTPSSDAAVRFLVEYLQPQAQKRTGYASRSTEQWLQLLKGAREARRSSRIGRPRTRNTATSSDAIAGALGRPISQYTALELEVHRAITVAGQADKLPDLPPYVSRAHDGQLAQVVAAASAGNSRCAVLVGGSSTGKTRACWEAIQRLPQPWRLWHPYEPTRPEAAATALNQVGSHTVVWLNEVQHYLLATDAALAERIAAGLRSLLLDRDRAPVLILGTIWREYWAQLTTPPRQGDPDPHAQARELLDGAQIAVSDNFSPADLNALQYLAKGDIRLRYAAKHAEQGRITQLLAGVPELERRYRTAPAPAKALIEVAMDARRLGHPLLLPHSLLAKATPGYLHDVEWDQAGDDWLERAFAYTARPCHGTLGPVTPHRPRPDEPTTPQPCYRLADYLDQLGRLERSRIFPPAQLWAAIQDGPTGVHGFLHFAYWAESRGRYNLAGELGWRAASSGNINALPLLAYLWRRVGKTDGLEELAMTAADHGDYEIILELAMTKREEGDRAGAEELYQYAADRGALEALRYLAALRLHAGDQSGAEAIYQQGVDAGDDEAMVELALLRERGGDPAGAVALAEQAATRGNTAALTQIADAREDNGDLRAAESLHLRAAEHGNLNALGDVVYIRATKLGDRSGAHAVAMRAARQGTYGPLKRLIVHMDDAGSKAEAEELAAQAVDLGDDTALQQLATLRAWAGDEESAMRLYRQAAEKGNLSALWTTAQQKEQQGDHVAALALYERAFERGATWAAGRMAIQHERLGNPHDANSLALRAADHGDTRALAELAIVRENAGDPDGAEQLVMQAIERGDPGGLRRLANLRRHKGNTAAAQTLYRQAIQHGHNESLLPLAAMFEEEQDANGAEVVYREAINAGVVGALSQLADLKERKGDQTAAEQIRRYGLNIDGSIATGYNW
ncbi:hypothetical protein AB0J80_13445 [Actinoplanes sp. NPDC049548]|uniref:tetratricopeptide repeat protein n=1 Tax=Actinoplanes sp. NPDC049548 TaxID=3155152 RepID=UPI00342E1441